MTISSTMISDLETYVTNSVGRPRRLVELTNLGDKSATQVRSAYLQRKCWEAIHWFQTEFGSYDADTADLDNDNPFMAYLKVMQLLYAESANGMKKAKEYESELAPLIQRKRASRTIGVETNSNRTEEVEPTGKVPFNEDFWKGVLPDMPGGDSY